MSTSNLIYDIHDKPTFGRTLLFALQQLLAIISATIAVPMIVGNGLSPAAALFGAGAATIVYLLITKFRSPMFFGSSFAFIGSMTTAFAGAASATLGYLGIIIGTCMVALINIIVGIVIKKFGVNWLERILPPAVIGPVVAIIGLSLAGTAIGGIWTAIPASETTVGTNNWLCLGIALVTLFVTMSISIYAKGFRKLVPFAIGIGIGYVLSLAFTGFGYLFNNDALKVIDFSVFNKDWGNIYNWIPDFTFLKVIKGWDDVAASWNWAYLGTIALAFIPVAVCTMAEHIADHENLSTIIGHDLLKDPGLHRTMIGDGAADAVGSFFGGVSTTSYGESLATTALTKNASTITILVAAIMAILVSFVGPFNTFLSTIPSCVLNSVCILLYGFIATSGLKMLKNVNLDDNRNIFTVSTIFVFGVGGFVLSFVLPSGNTLTVTTIACALIAGILVNIFTHFKGNDIDEYIDNPFETIKMLEKELKTKDKEILADKERMTKLSVENEDLKARFIKSKVKADEEREKGLSMWFVSRYSYRQLTELCELVGIDDTSNKTDASEDLANYFINVKSYSELTKDKLLKIISMLVPDPFVNKSSNKDTIITALEDYLNSLTFIYVKK